LFLFNISSNSFICLNYIFSALEKELKQLKELIFQKEKGQHQRQITHFQVNLQPLDVAPSNLIPSGAPSLSQPSEPFLALPLSTGLSSATTVPHRQPHIISTTSSVNPTLPRSLQPTRKAPAPPQTSHSFSKNTSMSSDMLLIDFS